VRTVIVHAIRASNGGQFIPICYTSFKEHGLLSSIGSIIHRGKLLPVHVEYFLQYGSIKGIDTITYNIIISNTSGYICAK